MKGSSQKVAPLQTPGAGPGGPLHSVPLAVKPGVRLLRCDNSLKWLAERGDALLAVLADREGDSVGTRRERRVRQGCRKGHRAPTPSLGAAPPGTSTWSPTGSSSSLLGPGFSICTPPRFPEVSEWGRKFQPSNHVVSLVPGPTPSTCVTS